MKMANMAHFKNDGPAIEQSGRFDHERLASTHECGFDITQESGEDGLPPLGGPVQI